MISVVRTVSDDMRKRAHCGSGLDPLNPLATELLTESVAVVRSRLAFEREFGAKVGSALLGLLEKPRHEHLKRPCEHHDQRAECT
jgi:hypothetical protein